MQSSHTRSPSIASTRLIVGLLPILILLPLCGCDDDVDTVRKIQAQQQVRIQSQSQQDHLGEIFVLLSDFVHLNPDQVRRQITFHLNRWRDERSFDAVQESELIRTVSDVLSTESAKRRISRDNHVPSDVNHLRDSYLFRRIVQWVDHQRSDDPLTINSSILW